MGKFEQVTLDSILSPAAAETARQLGSHRLASVSPDSLEAVSLRDLADFWNKARDGMPLPSAGALDPVKIPKHLSQSFLISVDHDPLSFEFRIIGEDPTEAFGVNVAGMTVTDIEFNGLPAGKMMHESYAWIVDQRQPVAFSGPNETLQAGYKRQEIIYLPFSNGSCQVSRILGASIYYRT
ncbi:PAS domain-containing protein [Parvibaculaceae bacterium PLY_AMNH_Bact1]|nr:PAS domain-containing protein [Parvibaculaceae bacterium PLY_AMNH_Bact1]